MYLFKNNTYVVEFVDEIPTDIRLVYVDKNRGVNVSALSGSSKMGIAMNDSLIAVNNETIDMVNSFGLFQRFWSTEPPFVVTFRRGNVKITSFFCFLHLQNVVENLLGSWKCF